MQSSQESLIHDKIHLSYSNSRCFWFTIIQSKSWTCKKHQKKHRVLESCSCREIGCICVHTWYTEYLHFQVSGKFSVTTWLAAIFLGLWELLMGSSSQYIRKQDDRSLQDLDFKIQLVCQSNKNYDMCVWFCSKSIYLKLSQLCSLVSFDLFGSVWPIAATNTPSSSRLRFGLFGQQKEVLFSYTCFHSCPGQQQGWTLSSPGKSKQRFKMNIHPPKTNMDTQNDGLENDFPF